MSNSQSSACLAAILLLLIAFIAFFAWARRRRQGFLSGGQILYDEVAPAPPPARKAAAGLYATLDQVVGLGDRVDAVSKAVLAAPPAGSAPGAGFMQGARQGVAHLTGTLRRTRDSLQAAPPTWRGYYAVYKGLALADDALLCGARAYEAAGHQIHQQLGAAQLSRAEPAPGVTDLLPDSPYLLPQADSGLAELGALLIALGAQLRMAVRDVHRLGVTLDLE